MLFYSLRSLLLSKIIFMYDLWAIISLTKWIPTMHRNIATQLYLISTKVLIHSFFVCVSFLFLFDIISSKFVCEHLLCLYLFYSSILSLHLIFIFYPLPLPLYLSVSLFRRKEIFDLPPCLHNRGHRLRLCPHESGLRIERAQGKTEGSAETKSSQERPRP